MGSYLLLPESSSDGSPYEAAYRLTATRVARGQQEQVYPLVACGASENRQTPPSHTAHGRLDDPYMQALADSGARSAAGLV